MKIFKTTTFVATTAIVMAGCVKDKGTNFALQSTPSAIVADFPNQKETAALDIVTTPTIYTIYAELSSANNSYPAGDVVITKNTAIVAADTTLEYLPDSAYQLVNTTATFDPVTHLAAFQIKVFTTKIDLAHSFAVGYTLSSVTNGAAIAANKNKTLIVVGAKNKYDGSYALRVKTTGWTAFGIADGVTADYPGSYDLITLGINNVAASSSARGDFLLPAFAGTANQPGTLGGPTGFGATSPVFYFDNSTNKLIDVVNSTPNDGRNRQLILNPAITDSRFDPATKNIYAAFIMSQNGRPNQFFYDTLTYVGPR
jgi:hypothetical protein